MPSNPEARAAIRALYEGRSPMEMMTSEGAKIDAADTISILDRKLAADRMDARRALVEITGQVPVMIRSDGSSINPGVGGEIGLRWPNGFGLAVGGRSSQDNQIGPYNVDMEYGGVTPSWRFGNSDGAWGEAGAALGAMHYRATPDQAIQQKMAPYGISLPEQEGTSPMVMPRVGFGYGPVGVDLGVIPPTGANRAPIGMAQFRLQKKF
jgi:hypothetical protein